MVVEGFGGGGTNNLTNTAMYNGTFDQGMHEDNISSAVLRPLPLTAVPIVESTRADLSGWAKTGTGDVFLTIDPTHNIIYLGESQIFDTTYGDPFLTNFLIYVKLASMWGNTFTDLMIGVDGDSNLPAPWDDVWGENKGISESMVK
jgi:hypothetical protein